MLKQKVIEPAHTEWAAAIIFAPKKDGTLILRWLTRPQRCHKARLVSNLTDEIIEFLGEAAIFSTLDMSSGY